MKPAAFSYLRPASISEAISALSEHGSSARLLAGGQSLVPMMNFRLVEAGVCIDINRIAGLAGIEHVADDGLRVGALTRHHSLEQSAAIRNSFPVLAEAVKHIGHLAIRNRGTIGGSLSHADPAAELPAIALLLDASIRAVGPSGSRDIAAADFFVAPLTTSLDETEIVTSVYFPHLPAGTGWGFREVARRQGDFAVAGASATMTIRNNIITEGRIALFGVDETPVRSAGAEAILVGNHPADDVIAAAARAARETVRPMNDLHASADYRRHLTEVLANRTLLAAAALALEDNHK